MQWQTSPSSLISLQTVVNKLFSIRIRFCSSAGVTHEPQPNYPTPGSNRRDPEPNQQVGLSEHQISLSFKVIDSLLDSARQSSTDADRQTIVGNSRTMAIGDSALVRDDSRVEWQCSIVWQSALTSCWLVVDAFVSRAVGSMTNW